MADIDIPKRELLAMAEKGERAIDKVRKYKAQLEESFRVAVTSTEVGGTALALGFVKGYWGGVKIMGVPVDLVVGVSSHVAGLVIDDFSRDAHAVGDGGLASFLNTYGAGLGVKQREKADAKKAGNPQVTSGASPRALGAGSVPGVLSAEELQRMAASV